MVMSELNAVLSKVDSLVTIREDAPLSYFDFGAIVCDRLGECRRKETHRASR